MTFKAFFRTVVFLLILFVVLYTGMNNTETINFSFPIAFQRSVHEPAALIFFAVFAVGVLGGMVLHTGGGGGRRSSGKEK